jgi:hypothetical protein
MRPQGGELFIANLEHEVCGEPLQVDRVRINKSDYGAEAATAPAAFSGYSTTCT